MKLGIYQHGRFLRSMSMLRDVVRIGRLPSCDLVLEGADVARCHAFIERSLDGNWLVIAMGPNNTRLNGHEVARAKAKIGDEVGIGSYKLMLMEEGEAPHRLPPPPPPADTEEPLETPDLVIVSAGGELIAAPVAPVLWAATREEMQSEPTTGEVPIPLELIEDEPIFLLTQRKRS